MHKKDIFAPALIIGLSIVFAAVSIAVYLSKGKSGFWVSKKMRLGAMLLTISAVGSQSCGGITPMCYDPAPDNMIEIYDVDYSNILEIDLKTDPTITGIIYGRTLQNYSFNITDSIGLDTAQKGIILAQDGAFDESSEEIVLNIDTSLQTNTYQLNIYAQDTNNQEYPSNSYTLILKNED